LASIHFFVSCSPTKPQSLSCQLNVLVRSADRRVEPVPVDTPGAVPVESGGAMCLDANFSEPAFAYLIWLDSAGQIIPLYPWNNETLEIKDIDEPPPERRAGKLFFSPLLGKSWTFGNQPGTETVLLLASKKPLNPETRLGELLKNLLAPSPLEPSQILRTVSYPVATPPGSSSPLAAFINPLAKHFEIVQIVQFAHTDQAAEASPPANR
jgi:hypothetical protein